MARSWSDLGRRARLWRMMHASWSLAQLAALGLIWHRVLTRRRDPAVWASAAFLAVEGGALIVGRGNCPMGALQERWGDPVPFFELVLTPKAAKAAIPVLAAVSIAAISALVLRRPGLVMRSTDGDRPSWHDGSARIDSARPRMVVAPALILLVQILPV